MESRFNTNLSLSLCSDATTGRFQQSCHIEATMAPVTQRAEERTFIQEGVPRVPVKQRLLYEDKNNTQNGRKGKRMSEGQQYLQSVSSIDIE